MPCQTGSAEFLRKLSALVCDEASSGEVFEQRVGCFRAVSNPNVGASSGSTFLKARIVLTVQGAANDCRRRGLGRVRKETEEAESDEAETFSSTIVKVSSLS